MRLVPAQESVRLILKKIEFNALQIKRYLEINLIRCLPRSLSMYGCAAWRQELHSPTQKHSWRDIKGRQTWMVKCVVVSSYSFEVFSCSIDGGHLFVFPVDGKSLLSKVGAWNAETGLREKYIDIKKDNRHPLKSEFLHKKVDGYINTVELQKETGKDGVISFTADSADQMLRVLLPTSEFRKEKIAICCSGTSVHFLKVACVDLHFPIL